MFAFYAAKNCRPKRPERHTIYKKAANTTPANPRPRTGLIISAAEAFDVLLEELEPEVEEPEPELEPEVEDELPDD